MLSVPSWVVRLFKRHRAAEGHFTHTKKCMRFIKQRDVYEFFMAFLVRERIFAESVMCSRSCRNEMPLGCLVEITIYHSVSSVGLYYSQKLTGLGNCPFRAKAIINFLSLWTPLMTGNSQKSYMINSERKLIGKSDITTYFNHNLRWAII